MTSSIAGKERFPYMRRALLAVALLAIAGIYSACGASRPVKFYTLSIPPAPAPAAAQLPVDIAVGRLDGDEIYRLDKIVYGSGPVERELYENDRWASPPVDMIRDLLVSTLRATGQYRSVSPLSSMVHGNYILRGRIFSLCELDKPQLVARFSARIDLYETKTHTLVWSSNVYSHDEPVTGGAVANVVEALDTNVSQGLRQLATELGEYFAAHPPAASSQSSD